MADFKIPAKFTVGGQEIEVKIVDRCDNNALGRCCAAGGYIKLARMFNCNGDIPQSETSTINSFFHELTHAILDIMSEAELSMNEKFVSGFAGFLTEAIRSMEYNKTE